MSKAIEKIKQYMAHKLAPYPNLYKILRGIYSIHQELVFLVHAIVSGKLFVRYSSKRFTEFCCRQEILEYPIPADGFETPEEFRAWLQREELCFTEGRWTFYLPAQPQLSKHFGFLTYNYPPDAGLKILKDFRSPCEARYVNHKQHPSPGAALKRFITPSPVVLLQVANYLYVYGLGIRVYDLIALKGSSRVLTCYVVQHVEGRHPTMEDYEWFMKGLTETLERKEITTIHEHTEMMADFKPPDCRNNLIVRSEDNRPLYVDFQGFLLDQGKWFRSVVAEVRENVHFGGTRFFRGGKYLYQTVPGLAIGKRDTSSRWDGLAAMLNEARCSLSGRVVYDVGCSMGLMLYNALSEGARWGIGWDLPAVVESAEKILLALGATRFDLFGEQILATTDFVEKIPAVFRKEKGGILFFLAMSKHIGFPDGVADIPWEYMLYEGHARETLESTIERFGRIWWLSDVQILAQRYIADGDTPRRPLILLRRS